LTFSKKYFLLFFSLSEVFSQSKIPWALLKLLQNLKLFKFSQNLFQINQIEKNLKRREKGKNRKEKKGRGATKQPSQKMAQPSKLPRPESVRCHLAKTLIGGAHLSVIS
jgi:hypothetical protein